MVSCPIQEYINCSDYKYNNQEWCYATKNLLNLISVGDFRHDYNNPYAMVFLDWSHYLNDPSKPAEILIFNTIFYLICYGYSIFRLVIDLAVILYAFKKIKAMMNDSSTWSRIEGFPSLKLEIEIYSKIIKIAVISEFFMSLHNFVVWRGLARNCFEEISLRRVRRL